MNILPTFNQFDHLPHNNFLFDKSIFNGFISVNVLDFKTLSHPGTYIILHPKSEKIYIGATSNIRERIHTHLKELKGNYHDNEKLQELYNDDNWLNFYFKETKNWEESFVIEQNLLERYIDKPYMLNKRAHKGFKLSEEIRIKMKMVRNTPRLKKFMSDLQKGKKLTPEHKEKLIQAITGRPMSERCRTILSSLFKGVKRNNEVVLNMKIAARKRFGYVLINGTEYTCTQDAANQLGISKSTVKYRIKSDSEEFKNWIRVSK